jgi:hypothetical protein
MLQTLVIEKNKTFYIQYSFFENRVVCEIMWKNIIQSGRPQVTIARWIPKATNTHTDYVIVFLVAGTRL